MVFNGDFVMLNLWSFELRSKWPAAVFVIVQEVGGRGGWPKVLSQPNRTSRSLGLLIWRLDILKAFCPNTFYVNKYSVFLYT